MLVALLTASVWSVRTPARYSSYEEIGICRTSLANFVTTLFFISLVGGPAVVMKLLGCPGHRQARRNCLLNKLLWSCTVRHWHSAWRCSWADISVQPVMVLKAEFWQRWSFAQLDVV